MSLTSHQKPLDKWLPSGKIGLVMTNTSIITQDWYAALVDECKAIITEAIFTSRWALVEGYWNLGKRIREDKLAQEHAKGNKTFVQDLARNLNIADRTIYYALQAYDKYPEIGKIPEGKNISWNKLITRYLPQPRVQEIPLPEGKYQVIYADPPWKYDVDLTQGSTRSPENNYPVMDLEELKQFGKKVREISHNDCVLFLWTTAPKFNWVNDVLDAWGFEYKTNLVWDKVKPVMGHYSSVRHEILVIAGKGTCGPTCDGKTIQSIDSVQVIEKTSKHSQKPNEFREIIEKLFPNAKRIELFAREVHDGWDVWGNEV